MALTLMIVDDDPQLIRVLSLSEATQDGLFDHDRVRRRALDGAMDQLRQRFGPRAVLRGQPTPGEQRDFRRDDLDSVTATDPDFSPTLGSGG